MTPWESENPVSAPPGTPRFFENFTKGCNPPEKCCDWPSFLSLLACCCKGVLKFFAAFGHESLHYENNEDFANARRLYY
jgi:hypothetical protein